MAITVTRIGTDLNSDANADTYDTASFDFVNGRFYLLVWNASGASSGDLAVMTVSGATSGTWTHVSGAASFNNVATPLNRLRFAYYLATGTFSETINLNCTAGQDQIGCRAVMLELTGMRTTSTVVQSDAGTGDAGTSVGTAITLASFADATNNVCIMAFGRDTDSAVTPSGSLLTLRGVAGSTPTHSLWVGYQVGENVNPSATWTGAADWGGIALEIAVASASVAGTSASLRRIRGRRR
jgi:hypothetical protein